MGGILNAPGTGRTSVLDGARPASPGSSSSRGGARRRSRPRTGRWNRKIPRPTPQIARSIGLTHDFGTILATGQELHHRFVVENPTDQPLRLVDPIAYTPCCSAIGPLPEAIPPGETAEVPVVYNTVGRKGSGRLNFSIRADQPDGPVWNLVLLSNLVPAWEIESVEGDLTHLSIGETAEQTLRVTCRRQDQIGLPAPTIVETTGPITAEFVGPTEAFTDPDGLVSNTRLVAFEVPSRKASRWRT